MMHSQVLFCSVSLIINVLCIGSSPNMHQSSVKHAMMFIVMFVIIHLQCSESSLFIVVLISYFEFLDFEVQVLL